MNPITRANIQHFCRICLRELPTVCLYKPNHDIKKENILELVRNIAGIVIEKKEHEDISSHPKEICHCCYIKTIALAAFRDKCIMAAGVMKMSLAENLTDEAIAKLADICRVCLKCCSDNENNNMLASLEQCTGLQIISSHLRSADKAQELLSDDRFPQKLCNKCASKLKTFMTFRTMAQQSEEYLKNLFLNDGFERKELYNDAVEVKEEFESFKDDFSNAAIKSEERDTLNMKIENDNDGSIQAEEYAFSANIENELDKESCAQSAAGTSTGDKTNEDSLPNNDKNETGTSVSERFKSKMKKARKQLLNCPQCEKKFYIDIALEGHIRSVHEGLDRPYFCKHCPSTFRQYTALGRHITLLHMPKAAISADINILAPSKKRIHICMICLRQFTRKDLHRQHMDTAHIPSRELRPFKCKFCEKGFGSRRSMLRHELNHSDARPFACDFCPKRYNSKTELSAHIERHTTKPELLCPICKRGKPNMDELQKHLAMHEANRQHQCTKCGRVFSKLVHLQEHDSAIHLKLRPFKCSHCEKTFATRRTAKEHEVVHDSRSRPIPCKLCQTHFKSEKSLAMHVSKEHSNGPKRLQRRNHVKTQKIKLVPIELLS